MDEEKVNLCDIFQLSKCYWNIFLINIMIYAINEKYEANITILNISSFFLLKNMSNKQKMALNECDMMMIIVKNNMDKLYSITPC